MLLLLLMIMTRLLTNLALLLRTAKAEGRRGRCECCGQRRGRRGNVVFALVPARR